MDTSMQEAGEPEQKFQPFVFQNEVKINDKVIFTIPIELQYPELLEDLKLKRPTRWGERRLRKNRILEDVEFNPVDGLVKRNNILAITAEEKHLGIGEYRSSRNSKWGELSEQTFRPPLLNYISPKIPLDQLEYIIRLLRLDEIDSQLGFDIPDDPYIRSPSPEPIYNSEGKRINTRPQRKKLALERERVNLIEDCMRMKKTFRPPLGYKKQKKRRKIYISDYMIGQSGVNFIGRIIGPGGQTQKLIEARTGCRIAVRGKGSNAKGQDLDAYDQLHVLVQAETDPQVDAGCDLVSKILLGNQDVDFKKENQQQIALMKGVFTEEYCENCKDSGHRTWACPLKLGTRVTVRCAICGEYSHPSFDCPQKGARTLEQIEKMALDYSKFQQQVQIQSEQAEKGLSFITDLGDGRRMIKGKEGQ